MNIPKIAWITVNHLCNLFYKWCYQKELSGKGKSMQKEMAKQIVRLLVEFQPRTIILIGGEPTLWNHYFTLIKFIKEKGLRTTIVSNGLVYANWKFTEKSKRSGFDSVTISVKAFSRDGYEKACGRAGGYDMVKRALINLKKAGIKTMISITISHSVIEKWKASFSFMREFPEEFYSFPLKNQLF